MSKLALIGGGTGFVGKQLAADLTKVGYSVQIISRQRRGSTCLTWKDIESNGLPSGTTAVVNLAGELVLNPLKRWSQQFEKELRDSRMGTTRLLRDAIAEADTKPLFWGQISGVGYYPPSPTLTYDEDSQPAASDDYWSAFTQEWEAAGELPESCSDVRRVVVRSGVVLGKNGGALPQMKPAFFMGVGGPMGSGSQWFPWIHIEDISSIFVHAIENDSVSGILNGVAPQAVSNKTFSSSYASALWRPSVFVLPSFAVRLMFGATRATMLLEGQLVTPKRTVESGYGYKYATIDDALKTCV